MAAYHLRQLDRSGDVYLDCSTLFQPDGTLVPQTGTLVGLIAPVSAASSAATATISEMDASSACCRSSNRYSANLIGHFEISPAFVPFFEAKYVADRFAGQRLRSVLLQGGSTGDRHAKCSSRTTRSSVPRRGSSSPTIMASVQRASTRSSRRRTPPSLTNRVTSGERRETYRLVGGVRGDVQRRLDASSCRPIMAEFDEKHEILGNVNLQRFLLAIDAVIREHSNVGPPTATSSAGRRSIPRAHRAENRPSIPLLAQARRLRPTSRPACRSTCSATAIVSRPRGTICSSERGRQRQDHAIRRQWLPDPAIPASFSICRAARSASRSVPNIGAKPLLHAG